MTTEKPEAPAPVKKEEPHPDPKPEPKPEPAPDPKDLRTLFKEFVGKKKIKAPEEMFDALMEFFGTLNKSDSKYSKFVRSEESKSMADTVAALDQTLTNTLREHKTEMATMTKKMALNQAEHDKALKDMKLQAEKYLRVTNDLDKIKSDLRILGNLFKGLMELANK